MQEQFIQKSSATAENQTSEHETTVASCYPYEQLLRYAFSIDNAYARDDCPLPPVCNTLVTAAHEQ